MSGFDLSLVSLFLKMDLTNLYEKLGAPSADKLFIAAKKQGLVVNKKQVQTFVSWMGERQVFKPGPKSRGQTASESIDARAQIDLIDFKDQVSEGKKNILVYVNVFTRELSAEALTDKQSSSVAKALKSILDGLATDPSIISGDMGTEFSGDVQDLLKERGIAWRYKNKGSVNELSVIDRAIQTLKGILARLLARDKEQDEQRSWALTLPAAVKGYNDTYHSTVRSEPANVRDNEVVQFMLTEDNIAKMEHNQTNSNLQYQRVLKSDSYREPLQRNKFQRGFKPQWGAVKEIESIEHGLINGKTPIKLAQPVATETTSTNPVLGAQSARTNRKREALKAFADALFAHLTVRKSTRQVSMFMKSKRGFEQKLKELRIPRVIEFIKLFPEKFKLVQGGYYVEKL